MTRDDTIRWAPKVQPGLIRRLYQQDALGIVDEELIDRAGWLLLQRCKSILMICDQQVACPRCGTIFVCAEPGLADDLERHCPADCGWRTTARQYRESYRHRDLSSGWGTRSFRDFVDRYERAASPQERMIAIDQLIHAFHQFLTSPAPHRSLANNLIEGSHVQVVALLDALSYGAASTPGLAESQRRWRAQAAAMWGFRRGKTQKPPR